VRITLIIHAIGGGGAERVMSIVANYWAQHGNNVTLITLAEAERPILYQIDPAIKINQIGVIGDAPSFGDLLLTGWQRIRKVRSAIVNSNPDIVISFMNTANVITLTACRGLKIPIIVSDHIYPGREDANWIWQQMMKIAYKWADRVTVLTQNALPFYPAEAGYRAIVMPNPILAPEIDRQIPRFLPPNSTIAIGRLHPQKGFDLLIQAFAKIHDRHPDWQLTILGEGDERANLESLRDRLGMTASIHLPGRVNNVNDYLAQADLFALPSRFEGFPMALCEAMAIGTPVVAFNCLSGPADIIDDGIDGVLVPPEDIDAFAEALDRLMSDPELRSHLATNAPQILERFGVEQVMQMWLNAIKPLIRH
jgi:GalNAc-alpha-(1->4)-GalNAc-alpha-(1->3)-diNAcBac-PP-undecaprenol alpha-1,4-N-acetyl-D-galactosaminyltransferase